MREDPPAKTRLDKWLWYARFFKTRGLSAKVVSAGHVRVNRQKVSKPAYAVSPGDVLTFHQAMDVRVIRVLALGERRGPADEAQTLYEDLDPPRQRADAAGAQSPEREGKGRPTKRERRQLDRNRQDTLD